MEEEKLKLSNLLLDRLNKVLEGFKGSVNNLPNIEFDYKLNKILVADRFEIQISYHMKNKGSKTTLIEIIKYKNKYLFNCIWDGKDHNGEEKSFNDLEKLLMYIESILDHYVNLN